MYLETNSSLVLDSDSGSAFTKAIVSGGHKSHFLLQLQCMG